MRPVVVWTVSVARRTRAQLLKRVDPFCKLCGFRVELGGAPLSMVTAAVSLAKVAVVDSG
jgi:hypothetical protein